MSAVSKVKKKIYKWSTMAIEGLLMSWGYRSCKVVVGEQGLSLRPHWRTDHQSAQVRPWFLKTCRWPQKFRQWNRQFVNIDDLVRQRGQLRQWFVNGSPMVLQWFVNKWWRQQKFVNNSSIVRQCARRVRQYWRTFWPLTNFLGHWRSFAVVSSYWRTIDELGCVYEPDRQYWRTACFIDELLWSAAYFEEPLVNCQTWALTSSSTIEK